MEVDGKYHATAVLLLDTDLVPLVQETGWAPGLVWTGVENLTPPQFDPWTIQLVVSCCTDYNIPAYHC